MAREEGRAGTGKSAIEIVGSKLSHESFHRDEIGEARNGSGRLTRVSADRTTDRSFNSSLVAASISAIIRRIGLESRALELYTVFRHSPDRASTQSANVFVLKSKKCRLPHFARALVFTASIFLRRTISVVTRRKYNRDPINTELNQQCYSYCVIKCGKSPYAVIEFSRNPGRIY